MSDHTSSTSPIARRDQRVWPLELIFDVVFVFAVSQTTELVVEEETTWLTLASGLIMVALLWRAWSGFAWLTSAIDPQHTVVRVALFGSVAIFLILATSIAGAFHGLGLLFAVCYGLIRVVHIILGWMASHGDAKFRATAGRNALGGALAVALLVAGALTHGPAQYWLWTAAIVADYLIPAGVAAIGWNLSPRHFAERHALIIILGLGETVLVTGVGITSLGVSAGSIALALVSVCLIIGLWSAYFDGVATEAEEVLANTPPGASQNGLARIAYTLLHLVMFTGDLLISVGIYSVLQAPDQLLDSVQATTLFGGLALYLGALVAFRRVMTHTLNGRRLALAVLMVLLIPVALVIPAWVSLTTAAALMVVLMLVLRTGRVSALAEA